jgi:hypothetical protein
MVVGATRNEEILRRKTEDYFTSYFYSANSFSREFSGDN